MADRAGAGEAALAHAIWRHWNGDHVDPEGEAVELVRLLAEQGWSLEQNCG